MMKLSTMVLIAICCLGSFANSKNRTTDKPYRTQLPYTIIYNQLDPKITPNDKDRRFIEVLIKPRYFTEANLKNLFQIVSKRYPTPETLFITVYTDRKDILTPKEKAEGILIVTDEQGNETQIRPSPEGRSMPKPTAHYNRYEGIMSFIMDGRNERITISVSQNRK